MANEEENNTANNGGNSNADGDSTLPPYDSNSPPAYAPSPDDQGLVCTGVVRSGAPADTNVNELPIVQELTRVNQNLTGLYMEALATQQMIQQQRRVQGLNNARVSMLENINQNLCTRRRNAAFHRLNPDSELQPLISVLRGAEIQGFPRTLEDLDYMTATQCMDVLRDIKAPFNRNGSVAVLRELILEEWCPVRVAANELRANVAGLPPPY